jgi:hypothetical protein
VRLSCQRAFGTIVSGYPLGQFNDPSLSTESATINMDNILARLPGGGVEDGLGVPGTTALGRLENRQGGTEVPGSGGSPFGAVWESPMVHPNSHNQPDRLTVGGCLKRCGTYRCRWNEFPRERRRRSASTYDHSGDTIGDATA